MGQNDLVLHLTMDNGNIEDNSIYNHAIENNGVEISEGKSGQGISLSGDSSFLSVPYNSNLEVPDQVSIAVWYQHEEQNNQSAFFPLVEQSTFEFGGHSRYGIWLQGNSYWGCIEPDDCGNAQLCQRCTSQDVNLEIGRWHHLAFTYDNVTLRLYVDGEEIDETSFNSPTGISTRMDALTIGVDVFDVNPSFLSGRLDDIRIYSRALSGNEIQNILQESCFTSVTEENEQAPIKLVYPNPTNCLLNLYRHQEEVTLSVYNIKGEYLSSFEVQDGEVNLCDLTDGIYYLRQDIGDRPLIDRIIIAR